MPYVPYKSPAFLARSAPLDNGLKDLCDLQIGRPLSQRDIAEFCGVSQQLVCRVEKRAMRKLRTRLAAIGIKHTPGFRGIDRRAALKGMD